MVEGDQMAKSKAKVGIGSRPTGVVGQAKDKARRRDHALQSLMEAARASYPGLRRNMFRWRTFRCWKGRPRRSLALPNYAHHYVRINAATHGDRRLPTNANVALLLLALSRTSRRKSCPPPAFKGTVLANRIMTYRGRRGGELWSARYRTTRGVVRYVQSRSSCLSYAT